MESTACRLGTPANTRWRTLTEAPTVPRLPEHARLLRTARAYRRHATAPTVFADVAQDEMTPAPSTIMIRRGHLTLHRAKPVAK
jgi:hypothetical protein